MEKMESLEMEGGDGEAGRPGGWVESLKGGFVVHACAIVRAYAWSSDTPLWSSVRVQNNVRV
jgi:hypothetical protein